MLTFDNLDNKLHNLSVAMVSLDKSHGPEYNLNTLSSFESLLIQYFVGYLL